LKIGAIYVGMQPKQCCQSGRAFRDEPGSGLSFSKCFGPISGLHAKLFITFRVTIFSFMTYIYCARVGDFCEWSDYGISSAA